MTTSPKKIEKVLDLWDKIRSVPDIAKITKLDDNTVRTILQENGRLPYSYKPSRYAQQGVPQLVCHPGVNQWDRQPSPQQNYMLQVAVEEGPKLVREWNRISKECEDKEKEIQDLRQQKTDLRSELDNAKGEKQDLTQQVEKERDEKKRLTDALEAEKREKQGLQNTVGKLNEIIVKMKQDHKRELEKEVAKVEEKKNHETLEMKKKFLEILEGRNTKLATVENHYNLLFTAHQKTTEENRQLKREVSGLKLKLSNSKIKCVIVGGGCFFAGMAFDHYVVPAIKKHFFPPKVEYRNNMGIRTPVITNLKEAVYEPGIHSISGVNLVTNTSGPLCSGAFYHPYGGTYYTECDTIPNQKEDVMQPDVHSEVTTETTGALSSGACLTAYGNNTGT